MKKILALILLLCVPFAAAAGRGFDLRAPEPRAIETALSLGMRVQEALEASGARVALVARGGQDLSHYGLVHTHAAFAWRDHPMGRWMLVHLLNDCGTDRSSLHDEGLGAFFIDIHRPEAQIVVPSERVQGRLVQVLESDLAETLHESRYNMVSFPFNPKYQNSNQWLLEVFAAATATDVAITSRQQAVDWLKATGYRPSTIELGTITRLGGRMFKANIAFDDHPFGRRMAGHIDTATVISIVSFIRARDEGTRVITVTVPDGAQ